MQSHQNRDDIMAYKNQNYMTNRKIKEEVDKNQKGYVDPEATPQEEPVATHNNQIDIILDKATYDAVIADENSGLSRYYVKYPREDGIDAEGNPVRDPDTEVVGHSWESAISAPTDPAETSTFPWISLALNSFSGTMTIKYDGETKMEETILPKWSLWIISVPNDLGMTNYRLEWGTGASGEKVFNP